MFGGVETLLVTLARHRDLCCEMEPEFALCWNGRLSQDLRESKVKVHLLGPVHLRDPFSVKRARSRLSRLLAKLEFDVVVCHMQWSQAVFGPVMRRANVPLVFWMHGATNGKHWLDRLANRTPPDLAICPSKYVASSLPNVYPETQAFVAHYPVAYSPTSVDKAEVASIRQELDTACDATVVVQASRMEEGKGQAIHLEALGRLRDLEGWTCWQVGGPQRPQEMRYFERLKDSAQRLGIADRVKFLGQRSDVPRLLAAANVYCQPNTALEGLPITFAEALYAGLPVVTSDICGFEELVDDSCGVRLPPGDVGAVAAALASLIRNPNARLRLATAASAQANKISNPEAQIPRLYSILEKAVSATSYASFSNN
jgi:glycosyltransferase involved in cell wall biosynthesis